MIPPVTSLISDVSTLNSNLNFLLWEHIGCTEREAVYNNEHPNISLLL